MVDLSGHLHHGRRRGVLRGGGSDRRRFTRDRADWDDWLIRRRHLARVEHSQGALRNCQRTANGHACDGDVDLGRLLHTPAIHISLVFLPVHCRLAEHRLRHRATRCRQRSKQGHPAGTCHPLLKLHRHLWRELRPQRRRDGRCDDLARISLDQFLQHRHSPPQQCHSLGSEPRAIRRRRRHIAPRPVIECLQFRLRLMPPRTAEQKTGGHGTVAPRHGQILVRISSCRRLGHWRPHPAGCGGVAPGHLNLSLAPMGR